MKLPGKNWRQETAEKLINASYGHVRVIAGRNRGEIWLESISGKGHGGFFPAAAFLSAPFQAAQTFLSAHRGFIEEICN